MKKIAAITIFVLTTTTPVYSYATDPCEVVLCMYGKATGNSGGSECTSRKHSSTLLRKRKVQYDGVKHLMRVKHF